MKFHVSFWSSLTCVLIWAFGLAAPPRTAERPNILWIVSDDLSPDLACYGHPLLKTPHLDRLARQGMRFTHAFTTAPVCSASRSAFFTGMYQTSIGAHNHRSHRNDDYRLPDGVLTVMERFRRAGYFTTTMANKAFESNAKSDYNFKTDKLFDGNSWSERSPNQPFFAYINFREPHRAFVKPGDVDSPVPPEKVILPPYYVDHPVARQDWAAYLNSIQFLDAKVGRVLKRLEDDSLAENTIVIFFGDHGRPHFRGKQFLYDGGIRVPLIVRWPARSDIVKPGTVSDDLISAIDIPATSLHLAGVTLPGSIQGQVFLGPKARKREYIFAARDRCDGTVDRIRCVRDKRFKYIRNFMPERPYTQFNSYKERSYPALPLMRELLKKGKLNSAQARFMVEARPREELYDLHSDSHEINNLASDPSYEKTLRKYRELLNRWIRETNDQGETPEDPAEVKRQYEQMKQRHEEFLARQSAQ